MAITIDATYEDGVLKPAQPLPFAEHTRVRVTIEQAAPTSENGQQAAPQAVRVFERIIARADALPEDVLAKLPRDGASQHDHYIYGTPKRTDLRD